MKNLIFAITLLFSISLFSQHKITEGVMLTKQTMTSSNEQMNMQLAMIGDMMTTTYFKNDKSRSEFSNPMAGNSTSIFDNEKKEMLIYMDNPMMGKKYMLKNIEASEEDLKNIEITKGEDTKTIAGYECQQYHIIMKKEGVDIKMIVFATEQLRVLSQQNSAFSEKFKGYPMYMEINANQMGADMIITYEVTSVEEAPVSDDKFDMTPPEGYQETDNLPGM